MTSNEVAIKIEWPEYDALRPWRWLWIRTDEHSIRSHLYAVPRLGGRLHKVRSDGLGVGGSTAGANASWNSAHANQNCANTAPRGGAGRIYCFARN
jgi:hypothetical protein